MGQRTANTTFSYLPEYQNIIKIYCSRSPRKSGDHEQGYFTLYCASTSYKKLMFAVLPIGAGHQTMLSGFIPADSHLHSEIVTRNIQFCPFAIGLI